MSFKNTTEDSEGIKLVKLNFGGTERKGGKGEEISFKVNVGMGAQ